MDGTRRPRAKPALCTGLLRRLARRRAPGRFITKDGPSTARGKLARRGGQVKQTGREQRQARRYTEPDSESSSSRSAAAAASSAPRCSVTIDHKISGSMRRYSCRKRLQSPWIFSLGTSGRISFKDG